MAEAGGRGQARPPSYFGRIEGAAAAAPALLLADPDFPTLRHPCRVMYILDIWGNFEGEQHRANFHVDAFGTRR